MAKKILVIDDDEGIRNSFALALEDSAYQVDTAESGERALKMLKSVKYSLIYLDLRMPGINGVETLRNIRQSNKKVPIYIITAFHKEFFNQLQEVVKEGIEFELLKKPLDLEEIQVSASAVLNGPAATKLLEKRDV